MSDNSNGFVKKTAGGKSGNFSDLDSTHKEIVNSFEHFFQFPDRWNENRFLGTNSGHSKQPISRNEYLHEGGWQNIDNPLHLLEFVQNEMHSFHLDQEHLEHRQCTICKESVQKTSGSEGV